MTARTLVRLQLRLAVAAVIAALAVTRPSAHAPAQAAGMSGFVPHEIGTGLRGGYQVVIADLNKDGKPDIIALASGIPELVWYENPGWQRHVLAAGQAQMINAARVRHRWRRHPRARARAGLHDEYEDEHRNPVDC